MGWAGEFSSHIGTILVGMVNLVHLTEATLGGDIPLAEKQSSLFLKCGNSRR